MEIMGFIKLRKITILKLQIRAFKNVPVWSDKSYKLKCNFHINVSVSK